jgi:hypothetical protein
LKPLNVATQLAICEPDTLSNSVVPFIKYTAETCALATLEPTHCVVDVTVAVPLPAVTSEEVVSV